MNVAAVNLSEFKWLQADYFALFGLTPAFVIDSLVLDAAYRQVQNQVHPDRFAGAGDAEKRVSMQWATRVNEAYQVLRKPVQRARYLCELHGVDLAIESNTAMPVGFLMQQMEWREALDAARDNADEEALHVLVDEVAQVRRLALAQVAKQLDVEKNATQAAQTVRQLMFIDRFAEELDAALDHGFTTNF